MSRLSALFACLLALVVASPLCCCAGQALQERESSCCCAGDSGGDEPCHRCPCASEDPREIPEPLVLPPVAGVALGCPPPVGRWEHGPLAVPAAERPRWTPSLPWHAPPAERRARLVSRLL